MDDRQHPADDRDGGDGDAAHQREPRDPWQPRGERDLQHRVAGGGEAQHGGDGVGQVLHRRPGIGDRHRAVRGARHLRGDHEADRGEAEAESGGPAVEQAHAGAHVPARERDREPAGGDEQQRDPEHPRGRSTLRAQLAHVDRALDREPRGPDDRESAEHRDGADREQDRHSALPPAGERRHGEGLAHDAQESLHAGSSGSGRSILTRPSLETSWGYPKQSVHTW